MDERERKKLKRKRDGRGKKEMRGLKRGSERGKRKRKKNVRRAKEKE